MAKRNQLTIIAEILRLARNGTYETRLVYHTNTNFKMLKKYISFMALRGLITVNDGVYKTTELGIEYLRRFKSLSECLIGTGA